MFAVVAQLDRDAAEYRAHQASLEARPPDPIQVQSGKHINLLSPFDGTLAKYIYLYFSNIAYFRIMFSFVFF